MTNRNNLSYLIVIFKCFRKTYGDPAHTKKDNLYTQQMILNSLEYSSLTNTTHRKETCLSQSPEQTIGENYTGQNKTIAI